MQIGQINGAAFKETAQAADTVRRENSAGNNAAKDAKLRKACCDFEALVLNKMLTMMRSNVEESGLLDKSYGHEMYQAMQDEQLARRRAGAGGIGLADRMYMQVSGQLKTSTGK